MRPSIVVLASVLSTACQTQHLPYESMSTGEVVTRVLQFKRPFDPAKKEGMDALRERFPIGTPYATIAHELSDARQRHLYASDFNGMPDRNQISFYVYRYAAGVTGRYKDGVMLFFSFDSAHNLREVTYANSVFYF